MKNIKEFDIIIHMILLYFFYNNSKDLYNHP